MAENQSLKKKKKAKKKPESANVPEAKSNTEVQNNTSSINNIKSTVKELLNNKVPKSESTNLSTHTEAKHATVVQNNTSNINNKKSTAKELLNIKTPNNIEVSLVQQNNKSQETANVVNSKKKKKSKKKLKDGPKETENQVSENESNTSLLNFTENGIRLVNHPEISVTFTNIDVPKVNRTENGNQQEPIKEEKKQNTEDSASSLKKKKKKKKKKGNNNPSPDVAASSNENTGTIVTPTYTKVVTSDNTCVLVVNNDNLAAAAKTYDSLEANNKSTEKDKVQFSLPNDKKTGDILITKKLTPNTNIQLSNTVSIFPVLTNVKENTSENKFSSPNLVTMSDVVKKDTGDIPENTQDSAPTKAQLKAERRAKQEAERAAKRAKANAAHESKNVTQNKTIQKSTKETSLPKDSGGISIADAAGEKMSKANAVNDKENLHRVRLFSHLPQHKQLDMNAKVHPAMLEVGYQHNKGIICGSNARCISLLAALREVIQDYTSQPGKNFCRELESSIQTYLSYLNNCRPLSVSMANAVKFLKHQINHMPLEMQDDKAKGVLCQFIDNFVNEEILLAKEAIGYSASAKIVDGDVILVFAHSSLVKHVLCKAHGDNKIFRVIVTDSRPKLEGLEMLRCLINQGLHCSYIPISAVSYVMKEVSKVIIGAHALLSNGCVMSRLGSKQIALVASSYSVPVIVCCETYKFCERVLTDSFVHNELGDPEDISFTTLVSNSSLKNWRDIPSLQLLNLLYDVTSPDLVSMVITEKGVLPCTSVPVVLRVRYAGLHE